VNDTVLIVDGPFEAGTDLVVEGLSAANVPVFRMDTADFPHRLEANASFKDGVWSGRLKTPHRTVTLSDVKAVYWNRPGRFEFPELSESDAHWARGAARIGLGGVLTSLDARWMNHPSRASAAEFKPRQLKAARAAGLTVPRTLITTSAAEVRSWAATCGGTPLITKPLGMPTVMHETGLETMYTRLVDLANLEGVHLTAHLFQEQVPKEFEVRAVVIGDTCHSVRIDTDSVAARQDWRADYDSLKYTPIETPCAVREAVRRYMSCMGLAYAALDFIVRPDRTWVFLEANPSGQWAWLHKELPLATLLADTLEEWCRT
jgi:ATP-grasp ribosomal peptide maturase